MAEYMVSVRGSNVSAMVDMVSEWSVSETAISVLWWTWSVDGQCHRQQCQCYGGHGQWMVSVRDSSVSAMVDMVSAACPLTDVVVH